MTFTPELAIWLIACGAGCVTAALSLRMAHLIYQTTVHFSTNRDLIDGMAHLRRSQAERVVGWALLFAVGVLALFRSPQPETPPEPMTLVGILIPWTLIGVIVLWSFETVSDYLFVRRQWNRMKSENGVS